MHPSKAEGPGASNAHGAHRSGLLGSAVTADAKSKHAILQDRRAPAVQAGLRALRATIVGSNQAEASGIAARGHAPVLALCRALIEAGVDPGTPLEGYRGTPLCLRVRSVGEGARLTVQDSKTGRPRFVRYQQEGAEGCVAAPYVAQTAQAADHDGEAVLGGV